MIGVYDYTVILTYMSAVSAGVGMIFAVNGKFTMALMMLIISGICDMFDGAVARTKKNRTEDEKAFGIQIDSLCDLIAFGVAPAVIGYSLTEKSSWICMAVEVMFPLCGLIRLAFYNVQEINRQKETSEKRRYFTGLPITTSAVLFPALYLLYGVIEDSVFAVVYVAAMAVLGILFITPLKVRKPGSKAYPVFVVLGLLLISRIIFGWY